MPPGTRREKIRSNSALRMLGAHEFADPNLASSRKVRGLQVAHRDLRNLRIPFDSDTMGVAVAAQHSDQVTPVATADVEQPPGAAHTRNVTERREGLPLDQLGNLGGAPAFCRRTELGPRAFSDEIRHPFEQRPVALDRLLEQGAQRPRIGCLEQPFREAIDLVGAIPFANHSNEPVRSRGVEPGLKKIGSELRILHELIDGLRLAKSREEIRTDAHPQQMRARKRGQRL